MPEVLSKAELEAIACLLAGGQLPIRRPDLSL